MDLLAIFAGCTAKPLLAQEPMAKHTSFRIGGPADVLAQPADEAELAALLKRAAEHAVPVTLIGNGSNLLVRDKGIRGLVIKLSNSFSDMKALGNELTFGSGISLAMASKKAASLSLNQDAMQYLNSFMRFQMMLADVTNSIQDVVKEAMGEK